MAENTPMPKKGGAAKPAQSAAAPKSSSKLPIILIAVAFVGAIVLGVGGFVGYKVFFSTPSPEQLCEKVRDLMVEEYKK